MDLLIQRATVLDRTSDHHRQEVDLLIRNGLIEAIGVGLQAEGVEVCDATGAYVSIGWVDIGVQTGDPGFEHRETLRTAAAAAAAGGFIGIGCQPNTEPAVDGKSEVLYVKNSTREWLVDCYPIGALSEQCRGKDITEMIDMHRAGAVAFSDGKHPVQDSGLMLRALQYVTAFDGVVINQPLNRAVAGEGQMHEGFTSTSLGMKGIPSLAEELMVHRDLELAAYTGARLHLANISTAGSVQQIRAAKARGLRVTCSVAALNLALSDEALQHFDTNLKVLPPLRGHRDIEALKEGLADGTIDIISSNHVPLEAEAKKLEFPFAKFGAIGLETAFALAHTHLQHVLELEQLIDCLAYNPRRLLGLPMPAVAAGQPARLTLFDPRRRWTFQPPLIHSLSRNTPLLGAELTGKVRAIINNNRSAIFEHP